MNRRAFVQKSLATAMAAPFFPNLFAGKAIDIDVRIERIICFRVMYDRPRIVAGNSGYKLAGGTRGDWMIALFGDNGKIGLGTGPGYGRPAPSEFPLGKTVGELLGKYQTETAESIGTTAVWDLAGKTVGKPVYELLGGELKKKGIQVYDGSIYMEELINRDANSAYRNPGATYGRRPSWRDIFKEAIDVSAAQGHTFVKVKIGRGHIHLERQAGNLQDAAILRLIREHGGAGLKIGVDANNGYTVEDTLWLLKEHGDLKLEFIEEMFPEDIEKYQQVRAAIRSHGLDTLIADGENWKSAQDPGVPEIIQAGVIDVLQGDMRRFQIEGILEEAELAKNAGHGARIAPHNWGCEFAFYVMVQMGNVIPHYYGAEHDPGAIRVPVLTKEGYVIKEGRCQATDAPGFGVKLQVDLLEKTEKIYEFK